jgi:DNA-binding ferritin-like protein
MAMFEQATDTFFPYVLRPEGPMDEVPEETLQSLYRGELAAVRAYEDALGAVTEDAHAVLSRAQRSHERRAELLAERIARNGGSVPETAGPWGTLTHLLEEAALTLGGERAAIAMLAQGEEHGLRAYEDATSELEADDPTRTFLLHELLPAHMETLEMVNALRARLGS